MDSDRGTNIVKKETSGSTICDNFLGTLELAGKSLACIEDKIYRFFPYSESPNVKEKDAPPETPFLMVQRRLNRIMERIEHLNEVIQREL